MRLDYFPSSQEVVGLNPKASKSFFYTTFDSLGRFSSENTHFPIKASFRWLSSPCVQIFPVLDQQNIGVKSSRAHFAA